jgi:hypothetical protein
MVEHKLGCGTEVVQDVGKSREVCVQDVCKDKGEHDGRLWHTWQWA